MSLMVVATVVGILLGLQDTRAPGLAANEPVESSAPAVDFRGGPVQSPEAAKALVVAENKLPGAQNWRPDVGSLRAPGLEFYADEVSVLPGQPVGLHLSATGQVQVSAYRMGWYQGALGRLVWQQHITATPQEPSMRLVNDNIPGFEGVTKAQMLISDWSSAHRLDTSDWPEGHYVLVAQLGSAQRMTHLTVRSQSLKGRLVMVTSNMSYQAYNRWGGRSVYKGVAADAPADAEPSGPERSLAVSFMRPYDDGGARKIFTENAALIGAAEQLGLPVAWVTDFDLAIDPDIVQGAAGLVFGAHAEYWTPEMRTAVIGAANSGTNVAVFGGNTAYWRVRIGGALSPSGRPTSVLATKAAQLDPMASVQPELATVRFRSEPHPVDETELVGAKYNCFPADQPWIVRNASWWGYAGADVREGQQIEGLLGRETDGPLRSGAPGVQRELVSHTTFDCGTMGTATHAGLYQSLPSGAATFSAGTLRWNCAMLGECPGVTDPAAERLTRSVTANILREFAVAGAGWRKPASDNTDIFELPSN